MTFTDKTSNLLTVQIYKDQHDGDYTTGAKGVYVYEKPDVGPSYCQLDQTEMSTSSAAVSPPSWGSATLETAT